MQKSELNIGVTQRSMIYFEAENEQVIAFRHHNNVFAIDNRCAHMSSPLCKGDNKDLESCGSKANRLMGDDELLDGVVTCPRHVMRFNNRTGESTQGGHMRQKVYPVRGQGNDIKIEAELGVTQWTPRSQWRLRSQQSLIPNRAKVGSWNLPIIHACGWQTVINQPRMMASGSLAANTVVARWLISRL